MSKDNSEMRYVKNQIMEMRKEMRDLLVALMAAGIISIADENGQQVYKINKVKLDAE